MPKGLTLVLLLTAFVICSVHKVRAQTTEFAYQGNLRDGGSPANGNYDFEFALFNLLSGGSQIGSTVPKNNIAVANGIFAVKLDFGSVFPGADRYLEIRVRLVGQPGITTLAPRQLINSSPYSVKSLNAANATTATTATNSLQLGGVNANQYVVTADPRLTDERSPTAGSPNYIQNQNLTVQPGNFKINGTGTANILRAETQFNILNNRVLSIGYSEDNLFVGAGAGQSNNFGQANTFLGRSSGTLNFNGVGNVFVGFNSGPNNTSGNSNTFLGASTGVSNTNESNNTFIGNQANGAVGITNATSIGFQSSVTQSNSLVLGSIAGVNGAAANTKVGIGTNAPLDRLHVNGGVRVTNGSIYVTNPNTLVITSPNGACWGITVNNAGALSTFSTSCP